MKIKCQKCHGYGLFAGQTIHPVILESIVICTKCREAIE